MHPTAEALERVLERLEALNEKAVKPAGNGSWQLTENVTDPKTDTGTMAQPVSY